MTDFWAEDYYSLNSLPIEQEAMPKSRSFITILGLDNSYSEFKSTILALSDLLALYYNAVMKKVAFDTIGCRLNQYETEKMAAKLTDCGFMRVEADDKADLYVINTCTVTGRADASCRRSISRANRLNENAKIIVVGCMVTANEKDEAYIDGADLVISNREKGNIVRLITSKFPDLFAEASISTQDMYDDSADNVILSDFHQHNRAWVKIGDGCNQKCSYCIVPLVRGQLVNRPIDKILSEINNLANHGYHEVVLTAVHIGQYSHGNLSSLSELIKLILSESNISRLRLSSIEPQEVNRVLLKTMSDAGARVCRHLHIPLQSGSDRILKLMKRPYTAKNYLETAQMAKDMIYNVVIGADVIVGFPGETEDDFKQTADIVKADAIDYLHVFSYSSRRGTEACHLEGAMSAFNHKEVEIRSFARYPLSIMRRRFGGKLAPWRWQFRNIRRLAEIITGA